MKKGFVGFIAAAVIGVLLVGAPAAGASTSTDKQFYKLVDQYAHKQGMTWTHKAEKATALATCEAFDEGATEADVVTAILGGVHGKTKRKLIAFAAGAGVAAYCPQYNYQFGN